VHRIMQSVREKRESEEGFTLIELMVVVLIIAILIAIAIPTFLGARQKAQNRGAQSSLRNSLTASKTLYTDTSDYSGVTTASLLAVEPSLTYAVAGTSSSGMKNVSVGVAAGNQTVGLAALAASGNCYYIRDTAVVDGTFTVAGTFYAPAPGAAAIPASACNATAALATAATTNGASW